MKKIFFLACLMLSAVMVFAQETKKVAILEVVDKEGNISYANKLILRSNLAKAITNTPGYEAYDRTDMDAILGEQNFQRTGMVSNDQIKRLGEMTGAKFVLVAEAAIVDANTMYITAKLLDVETARTEMTDNQMMGTSAKEIQRGCQLLAANLIKPNVATQIAVGSTVKHSNYDAHEKQSYNQPISNGGMISKISNNEYRIGETKMDKKAYEDFIYNNCPQAWKRHIQAKRTIVAGWSFFSVGIALSSMWGLYGMQTSKIELPAITLGSIGAAFIGLSIPLLGGGYSVKNNTYKVYNMKCTQYASSVSLNLTSGQNGLGLALQF